MKLLGPAVALALSVGLLSCQQAKSSPGGRWSKEAAELCVYATQVPIYPGANLDDAMGADLYGDTREDHTKRMTFFFDVEDGQDEIVAWYDEQLPDAAKETTDDGEVVYTMAPEGGEEGENIGVMVGTDGRMRIFENTNAGSH